MNNLPTEEVPTFRHLFVWRKEEATPASGTLAACTLVVQQYKSSKAGSTKVPRFCGTPSGFPKLAPLLSAFSIRWGNYDLSRLSDTFSPLDTSHAYFVA